MRADGGGREFNKYYRLNPTSNAIPTSEMVRTLSAAGCIIESKFHLTKFIRDRFADKVKSGVLKEKKINGQPAWSGFMRTHTAARGQKRAATGQTTQVKRAAWKSPVALGK